MQRVESSQLRRLGALEEAVRALLAKWWAGRILRRMADRHKQISGVSWVTIAYVEVLRRFVPYLRHRG
jgi:hypothetical protein